MAYLLSLFKLFSIAPLLFRLIRRFQQPLLNLSAWLKLALLIVTDDKIEMSAQLSKKSAVENRLLINHPIFHLNYRLNLVQDEYLQVLKGNDQT